MLGKGRALWKKSLAVGSSWSSLAFNLDENRARRTSPAGISASRNSSFERVREESIDGFIFNEIVLRLASRSAAFELARAASTSPTFKSRPDVYAIIFFNSRQVFRSINEEIMKAELE